MSSWKSEMTSADSAAFLLYMAGVVWLFKYKSGFGGAVGASVLSYPVLATLQM